MSDVVQKLWGFCHTLRHDGVDYGDYIEQMVVPHVRAVVHDVTVMAEQFQRSGIARSAPEQHGISRSAAE